MVEVKRTLILIVSAQLAPAAFMLNRHGFDFASPLADRHNEIFPSVGIGSNIFRHNVYGRVP